MKRLAVLVSGSGSNLQAIIDEIELGHINGEIVRVISSKADAYALERATRHGIGVSIYEKKAFESLEKMYQSMMNELEKLGVEYILLAGYMLILSPNFIAQYRNRIVNIHPSLIPSFCGKGYYGLHVHEAVLAYGAKVTGVTVHFVDEGADTGAIIAQRAVSVEQGDTPVILQQRVLKIEHELFPYVVGLLCSDKLRIEGRKVIVE